jgi:transcriptional regulator with XRE-family HTH domain
VIELDFIVLGKRIRARRRLLGLSMEKLAENIDKSTNFMGQIERGDRKMSLSTLLDIANALGVSVDYLLSGHYTVSDNNIKREIDGIIDSVDEKSQRFILDVARRCKEYCGK